MKPKALLFDVFGTVVDWRSGIARDLAIHFQTHPSNTDPESVADAWRAEYQPSMEPVRSGRRGYVDLDTLHAENLVKLSKEFEFELGDENQPNWLTKAWHRLPCWPDSVSGIERLKRKLICASQSNGHIALAFNLAKYNGYSWDVILGSEVVRTYKPAPESYSRACSALQLKPAECMMVAAHNSDLQAAQNAGMQTAFVRRQTELGPNQQQDLRATGQWSLEADSIIELADRLANL